MIHEKFVIYTFHCIVAVKRAKLEFLIKMRVRFIAFTILLKQHVSQNPKMVVT